MEEKKTIFDYLGQVFMVFGITVVILNVLCALFGEGAKEISSMFSLGNQGISVPVLFQFLAASSIIVLLRFLFFTDVLIKKMPVILRTVCMIGLVLLTIIIFIVVFDWFPTNLWQPWCMFFLCFGVCFMISMFITIMKENIENRKMKQALERLKQEENH